MSPLVVVVFVALAISAFCWIAPRISRDTSMATSPAIPWLPRRVTKTQST